MVEEKKSEYVDDLVKEMFSRCIDNRRKLDRNGQPEQFLKYAPAVIELMIERFYDLPWILQDKKDES